MDTNKGYPSPVPSSPVNPREMTIRNLSAPTQLVYKTDPSSLSLSLYPFPPATSPSRGCKFDSLNDYPTTPTEMLDHYRHSSVTRGTPSPSPGPLFTPLGGFKNVPGEMGQNGTPSLPPILVLSRYSIQSPPGTPSVPQDVLIYPSQHVGTIVLKEGGEKAGGGAVAGIAHPKPALEGSGATRELAEEMEARQSRARMGYDDHRERRRDTSMSSAMQELSLMETITPTNPESEHNEKSDTGGQATHSTSKASNASRDTEGISRKSRALTRATSGKELQIKPRSRVEARTRREVRVKITTLGKRGVPCEGIQTQKRPAFRF